MTINARKRIFLFLSLFLWLAHGAGAAVPPGAVLEEVRAKLNVSALSPGSEAILAIVARVPAGLHAQSHWPSNESLIPFDLQLTLPAGLSAQQTSFPPASLVNYPALGELSVYSGQVVVRVKLRMDATAPPGPLTIKGQLSYQLCNDTACFAPAQMPFELTAAVVAAAGEAIKVDRSALFVMDNPSTGPPNGATVSAAKAAPVTIWGRQLGSNAYGLAFAAALVVGMLFNVMPCVLPVLPLKAMGFYEVSQHHRGKSLFLGAVFSLGIITVFAILGLLVVVFRTLAWGQLYGNGWFLGAIVLLLGTMGLSLFGLFNVNLPTGVYRFAPRHDTATGNYLFGILAAILSTPCTFGLFLGLLVWATQQPGAIGLGLMMTVGLGMALPYLLLSGMPQIARNLPRSGPMSLLVKEMMGFLLIGSAVYFARRWLAGWLGANGYWWALFAVALVAGAWLAVQSGRLSRSWLGKLIGLALAVALVGSALGLTLRLARPAIAWQAYSPQTLQAAREQGKMVWVEFTADWCGNCLALEATVFHDRQVVATIKRGKIVPLRADVTRQNASGWELLGTLSKVGAVPLSAIYPPDGGEPLILEGIYSAGDWLAAIERAKATR